jgi:hypothetical protein
LRSLGLERYEATFRENEIDDTVLPNLTAEHLKDLGVSIVGHSRKVLDAIAALRADRELKTAPAAPKSAKHRFEWVSCGAIFLIKILMKSGLEI